MRLCFILRINITQGKIFTPELRPNFNTVWGQYSVFGIPTHYGLEASGFEPGECKRLSLLHTCPAPRWYQFFEVVVGFVW
jgi:hypothetical protein